MKKIQLLAAAFIFGSVLTSTSLMAQNEEGNQGDAITIVDPSTGEEIDLEGLSDEEIQDILNDIFGDEFDGGDPGDDFPAGDGNVIVGPNGEIIDLEGLSDQEIEALLEELFGDGTIGGGNPGDDLPGSDGNVIVGPNGEVIDLEGLSDQEIQELLEELFGDNTGGNPGDGWGDPGDDFNWEWDWDWDDDGVSDEPISDGDIELTQEDIEYIFGPGAELPDGFTWADLNGLSNQEWEDYTTFEVIDFENLTDEEMEDMFGDEFIFTGGPVLGGPGGIDQEWYDEDYIIDLEEELTEEEIEELINGETYVFTEDDIEELYEEFVTLFGDDFITYEEFLDSFGIFLGNEASERLAAELSVEESAVANFTVYPNPATDVLNVNLALNDGNTANIVVTNLAGQTVYALNNVNNNQAIQLNGLTAGIYTVRLTVAQEDVQVLKFVKQ